MTCLVILFTGFALAQRDLGTITGTVTDPSGAVVPGAAVTITEVATGQSYKVQATGTGDYARPALPPGTYTVTAEAPGFRRVSQQNVEVTAGGRVGVPLTLVVGDVSDSVVVTSDAPLVQTESTTLGAQLTSNTVENLPLGGQRVFTFLARLSPGVLPAEPGSRDGAGGGFSANGVRSNGQNNFLLNGVDNNVNVIDFMNGTSYVIGPPPEAIGEMQVLTSGYNAEYGRAAGGVINVNLKTGTNQLHGGVWEVLQNDKLNSNSWANKRLIPEKPRPIFKQNQFGGAAGGPIVKNRFFIFGDYQGTRIAQTGRSGLQTIPTQAMTNGDFSGLLGSSIGVDPVTGNSILRYQIYDPLSTRMQNGVRVRDPFIGNKIPSNRFDSAAAKILKAFPAENQPVNGFPLNDYYYSTPGTTQRDSGDVRADFRISDKGSLYGSLSWNEQSTFTGTPLPGALDAAGFGGETQQDQTRNAQLGYTRVWNASLITESRVAFSRLISTRAGPLPEVDQYKAFGIGGYNPTNLLDLNGGLPFLTASRYFTFGASEWLPTKEYSNVWDFIQNVSVVKGAHALKFGAEFRPMQFPFAQYQDNHGRFNFVQDGTAYPSQSAGVGGPLNSNTGDAIATFLLGFVDSGAVSTSNVVSSQKKSYAFYAQDDWKISRKVTLNIGLRYELFSPSYEKFGQQANFVLSDMTLYIPKGKNQDAPLPPNFATAFPNVKVSRGAVSKYMYPWDKLDFGPRIGLAYNVIPKTVIRLGFGIFYGGEENMGGNPNLGFNAPFNYTITMARTDRNLVPIDRFDANPWFPGGLSGGFPLGVFNQPAQLAFRSFATNFRNPMVQKWNVAVQRELPGRLGLELAYVGNNQIHQVLQHGGNPSINSGDPKANAEGQRLIPYIGGTTATDTYGYGNYHGFTAKLERRLSQGLEFISSYTWGHAMSNSNTTLSGGTGAFDPTNFRSAYANALWDIRHNFTTGYTYELPFGKGKAHGANLSPVLMHAFGGWALNGILTIRTGRPLTLGSNKCIGVWASCRVDLVAGKNADGAPPEGRGPAKWFDTSAVAAPAAGTGGNAGAYNMHAPGTSTLDASLFKSFRFTERWAMEFRAETFNLFNKVQLGNPDMNLQNTTFGSITGSSGQRSAQFSLRLRF